MRFNVVPSSVCEQYNVGADGFTFLLPAHTGSPGKGSLNGCVWWVCGDKHKFVNNMPSVTMQPCADRESNSWVLDCKPDTLLDYLLCFKLEVNRTALCVNRSAQFAEYTSASGPGPALRDDVGKCWTWHVSAGGFQGTLFQKSCCFVDTWWE